MALQTLPTDDLRDLKPVLLSNAMIRVLVGNYKDKPASLLARNALRLMDQAVQEYQLAFADLKLFVKNHSIDSFFRAQGHLETCIMSMHRSLNFATRLRRYRFVLPDGSLLIPKTKDLAVLTDPVRTRIRDIRNAIVHIDDEIIAGKFPPGRVIAIDPSNSGISLEGITITWEELTRWLRELYALGQRFSS